jgi:hypothetical protein
MDPIRRREGREGFSQGQQPIAGGASLTQASLSSPAQAAQAAQWAQAGQHAGTETAPWTGTATGGGSVRAFFGLQGSGLAKDEAESDGSLDAIFRIALEDSLAVTCLYAIVVCGRGLTTPGAMSVFSDRSFWLWLAILIVCNMFLQVFYPPLRQQLVQATVFSVVLVLMSPIKTPALVP